MSDYLKRAVDLSRSSLNAGKFPAGAVLVTKSGNVYESDPSIAYYHGECMVIDKAINAEGYPLEGAIIYSSMESCLMCSSKMYWAGVKEVHFVIPKSATNILYAYEDSLPISDRIKQFNVPIHAILHTEMLNEALGLYNAWVDRIEAKK